MIRLQWLKDDPLSAFPPLDQALTDPNGLLAAGGDLSPQRLLNAYRHGIFPWYNEGEPILWWSPDPRCVLFPEQLKISRSLSKTLKKQAFVVTADTAFGEVMKACSLPRKDQPGTWITNDIYQAYVHMHELGYAHSIECWQHGQLVGGLYGMALGKVFFGESMFSQVTDASKVALVSLCELIQEKDFKMIDSQVHTPHMERMGAEMIPRQTFLGLIKKYTQVEIKAEKWTLD